MTPPPLALGGVRVWDGVASAARAADLWIDEGRVAASAPPGATPIELPGCTAIPGLIDAHAHLCFNASSDWRAVYDSDTPSRLILRMAGAGRAMLEAGITTVRDLGAPTDLAVSLREAFATGLARGPRLLVSGAPITTTGGHCHFLGGEADGELAVRKAVRERVKAGCDWIKVMATGGNMTRGTNTLAPQYTVAELAAVVDDAHRLRRRVTAHCHGTAGIRNAVAAAVDMVEHCSFTGAGTIDYDPEMAKEIAHRGIVVSPTVSVGYRRWPDDGLRKRRGEVLRSLLDAGCRLIMSTDCGIPGVPHGELAGGMQVLAELTGLRPVEVLKLATSTSAELLGLDGRGTLLPGSVADVVVIDGDPTTDLSALERVRMVILGGEVVHRALP
jgi:imidazolonepropionase-like amidohydrolase